MIQIGHVFQTSGAVALLTAPADNDSIIVLSKQMWSGGQQYITGRVYVAQLPTPRNWDNGTYHDSVEEAVREFMDRSGLAAPGYDEAGIGRMVALVHNVETRLVQRASA